MRGVLRAEQSNQNIKGEKIKVLRKFAFLLAVMSLVLAACTPGLNFNEYTFRTSRNNYQDSMNECIALTQQYTTFVQTAPDYAFGQGSAAAFRDACTFRGAEFVADDILAPLDTPDFTPYMEQIANSGAEACIVTWAGSAFVSLVANTKPCYGVNPDLFDGDGMNAASLVVEAIKATGGDGSGDALKRRPAKFGQMRGV